MPREVLHLPGSTIGLPVGAVLPYAHQQVPSGWLSCDGSAVLQSQYPGLFALVGTRFGAAAAGYFRLPDLRGRTVIGSGQGAGLSLRTIGEQGGEETHTLIVAEIPAHPHAIRASGAPGTSGTPAGNYPAANTINPSSGQPVDQTYSTAYNAMMNADAVAPTGGGLPHNNMQPYCVLHYIVRAL